MLVFPQLATGASAVYPVARKYAARTVVNALGDGSTVIFADSDAAMREWELRATGLTLNEWTAIEALFQAVAGRFAAFTFLGWEPAAAQRGVRRSRVGQQSNDPADVRRQ